MNSYFVTTNCTFVFRSQSIFDFFNQYKNRFGFENYLQNHVKYHQSIGNLGRQSGQCKPPASFLLGWTSTFKINYLQVFSKIEFLLLLGLFFYLILSTWYHSRHTVRRNYVWYLPIQFHHQQLYLLGIL